MRRKRKKKQKEEKQKKRRKKKKKKKEESRIYGDALCHRSMPATCSSRQNVFINQVAAWRRSLYLKGRDWFPGFSALRAPVGVEALLGVENVAGCQRQIAL